MRRGVKTKLVLSGLAQQNYGSRCDPALIEAIARGRAWFEELCTGRARSLQELSERDAITRRRWSGMASSAGTFRNPNHQLVHPLGLNPLPDIFDEEVDFGRLRVETLRSGWSGATF